MQFVDVLVRQAHPGPDVRPYQTFDEKMQDAHRYKRDERIPWTVLVDDLAGTVHQVYSGLADPTYLIDVDGRVAFFCMWTYAPSLHDAIDELLDRGGRGVVNGGIDHVVHLLPAMTDGWKGISRGLPQSFTDLETASPGMASGIWLGHQLRPVLAPITLRAEPLSPPVKTALVVGGAVAAVVAARWMLSRLKD